MNEPTNTNQPMRPDFSGSAAPNYNDNLSGPTPLNTEGFGSDRGPAVSGWSPGIAPTPGPLNEVAPLSPVTPNVEASSFSPLRSPLPSSMPPMNNSSERTNIAPSTMSAPVPPPSAIQYEIKTLASDAEALKASGGAESLPQTMSSLPNITQTSPQAPASSFVTTPTVTSAPTPVSMPTTSTPASVSAPTPSLAFIPVPVSTAVPIPATVHIPAPAPIPSPSPSATPTVVSSSVISSVPTYVSAPTPVATTAPTPAPAPAPLPPSTPIISPNITQPASYPSIPVLNTNPAPQTFSPSSLNGEDFFSPAVATVTAPVKKKGISKTVFIIGAIIVLIGLAMLIVLFAAPLFRVPTPALIIDPLPVITVEADPPLVVEPEPLPAPVIPVYASFFSIPANFVERPIIENITLESLKQVLFASLTGEPARAAARDRMIREVIITSAGTPLAFSTFLPTFLPDINAGAVSTVFEDNFTLFVHENRFIGFIAQTKIGATPAELASFTVSLEASPNLSNFYATDPGAKSAFTDGTINGNPVRRVTFATAPGQAFHYGWFRDAFHRNYLIVSISYEGEGIIEAVRRARLH